MSSLPFPLWVAFGAGTPSDQDIADMVAAGCAGVRTGIVWDKYDPGFTGAITAPTTTIDHVVQTCNANGLKVDLQIALGPTFGGSFLAGKAGQGYNEHAPGASGPTNVPRGLSMFGVSVAAHFAQVGGGYPNGQVHYLELGNEPNHSKWDDPTLGSGVLAVDKGFAYVKMMARFYGPAKAANPQVKLIIGGLGGQKDDANDVASHTFTQNMYDAVVSPSQGYDGFGAPTGIHGLFDHYNAHPYCYPQTPTQDIALYVANPPTGGRGWAEMLELMLPILAAHGDDAKGVMITEYGAYNTTQPGWTLTDIAAELTDACVNQWATYGWGGAMGMPLCWFQWQDGGVKGRNYGLIDANRAKKQPLWDTYHALSGGGLPPNSPTVSGLSGTHGPGGGGTVVTVTGTNLTGALSVQFGANLATSVVPLTASTVRATAPAGTGVVDVTVTTPVGTTPTSSLDLYTYDATTSVPVVASVSPPSEVGTAGGHVIGIAGNNFTGTTAVTIGGTACTSVVVWSDSLIGCVTPAKPLGNYHTKVTNAIGQSAGTNADVYSYTTPPVSSGGIGICSTNSGNQTTIASRIATIWSDAANTNPRLVRVDANWSGIQAFAPLGTAGQNDTFIWSALDAIVDAHQAAGNLVLLVCGIDTPGPLRPPGSIDGHVYPNRDSTSGYRDYANFVWSVANRYCGPAGRNGGGTVVALELWNEPNNGFGLNPVNALSYWSLFTTAAKAVKTGAIAGRTTRTALDSSVVKIVSAGCGPVLPGTANATDRWVQTGLSNGAGPYLDAAGTHPYGLQCPPTKNASWNQRLFVIPQLRTVLDTAGLTQVEIWLTEDGCFTRADNTPTNTADTANCGTYGSTPGDQQHEITEAQAAIRIGELIGGPSAWFWANKAAYKLGWLTYYQDIDTGTNWGNSAGLFHQNGTKKLEVYNAFVSALGAGGTVRTAPTASISSPADDPGHIHPVTGAVVFICPSTDAVDTPDQLTVKLYRGAGTTLVGNAIYNPFVGWYYPLDSTTLTNGNYQFVTKVTNTANLTTTSSVINVTVTNTGGGGNVAPVVRIVSVTGTDGIPHATPGTYIVKGVITVEISVVDDHDTTILPVLYAGAYPGVPVGTATPKVGVANHYVITFDTNREPNGVEQLIATATDSGGLTGVSP